MQNWLEAQMRARPEAPAVYYAGVSTTYRQLHEQVERVAVTLHAQGIGVGSVVAVLMGNSLSTVHVIHGLMRVGATLVMLNTRLTVDELDYQVQAARCSWVLHDEGTCVQAEALSARLGPNLKTSQVSETPDVYATPWPAIALDAPAVIMFTSGSSGTPKGVVLSWGNFWHSAMASAYRIGVLPNERWLCVLPLYHVGGLSIVLRSCLYGTAIDIHTRFDTDIIYRALSNEPITLISLVPTMLHRLLEGGAASAKYPYLRLVLLGGAAAAPELMARAAAKSIPIATTYGLTEATSQVATALPADTQRKPDSVGKGLVFTDIRVVDEASRDLVPGEIGEVIVCGPTVMHGYLNDPIATAHVIRDGWLYTGDLGFLDAEGDLHLVQRRSDLIVTGGENVYPAEVEAVLRKHPAVYDVVVVGVPSAEWGQQVAALVVPATSLLIDVAALTAFCRQSLAGYKVPRLFRLAETLPQTASGKIDRIQVGRLLIE